MNYSFHPEAEEEFLEAIEYYENQQIGLGLDLSVEVHKTISRILSHPESWTRLSRQIRRILVHRFPYALLYHYNADSRAVYIIAVMHLHREPDFWIERV